MKRTRGVHVIIAVWMIIWAFGLTAQADWRARRAGETDGDNHALAMPLNRPVNGVRVFGREHRNIRFGLVDEDGDQ